MKKSEYNKKTKRIAVRFMGWNVQYYNSFRIDLEIQCNLTRTLVSFGDIFGRGRRFDKSMLKFMWICKKPRVAQKIWKINEVH